MEVVQRMVSLGRAARSSAQVRVRQPLGTTVLVPRTAEEQVALERLAPIIAEELNVKAVEVTGDAGDRVSYSLRPNLPVLGPRYGKDVGKIRGALEAADAASVVRSLRAGEAVQLGEYELGGGDVLVGVEASDGWAAAEDGGYVALLDMSITPELRAEGLGRELVRRLQDLRREAELDVSDRIDVRYVLGDGAEAIGGAFAAHGGYIAEETLALSIEAGDGFVDGATSEATIDGMDVVLSIRKTRSGGG
jgi:isoleucyl-tRNA synthetase